MKQLIVMASEEELKILPQLPPELARLPKLITGIGAINIIKNLNLLPSNTHLINIGYAGAKNINVGTIVEITEAHLLHPTIDYPEPQLHLMPLNSILTGNNKNFQQVVCYTSTDFVSQSDYENCAFDMELAFIASFGFPLTSLKMISDNLSHTQYIDFANNPF